MARIETAALHSWLSTIQTDSRTVHEWDDDGTERLVYVDGPAAAAALADACAAFAPIVRGIARPRLRANEDAEAIATEGLIHALRTVDPSATVRQVSGEVADFLSDALAESGLVRLPNSIREYVRHLLVRCNNDPAEAWRVYCAHRAGEKSAHVQRGNELSEWTFLSALRSIAAEAGVAGAEFHTLGVDGPSTPFDENGRAGADWADYVHEALLPLLTLDQDLVVRLLYGFPTGGAMDLPGLVASMEALGIQPGDTLNVREVDAVTDAAADIPRITRSSASRLHRAALVAMRLQVEADQRGLTVAETEALLAGQAAALGISTEMRLGMSAHEYLTAVAAAAEADLTHTEQAHTA